MTEEQSRFALCVCVCFEDFRREEERGEEKLENEIPIPKKVWIKKRKKSFDLGVLIVGFPLA